MLAHDTAGDVQYGPLLSQRGAHMRMSFSRAFRAARAHFGLVALAWPSGCAGVRAHWFITHVVFAWKDLRQLGSHCDDGPPWMAMDVAPSAQAAFKDLKSALLARLAKLMAVPLQRLQALLPPALP